MVFKIDPVTIIGLDIGERRIGIARGTTTTRLASPLTVLLVGDDVVSEIDRIAKEQGVTTLVIGYPRSLDGTETKQTKWVKQFVQKLKPLGLEIVWQDEAATTLQAEAEQKVGRKKYAVDAHAAAIILQDYLDTQS